MNLGIGNDEYQANWAGQTSDVRYTGDATDSAIDLDWDGIEKYGTYSEVGNYLLNRDGNCDNGEFSDPSEIEVYKVFGKGT